MGLIFEPQRAQRARENGRKSSPMLRLRGKQSLCDLCELGFEPQRAQREWKEIFAYAASERKIVSR
jgi:hypothetical protein